MPVELLLHKHFILIARRMERIRYNILNKEFVKWYPKVTLILFLATSYFYRPLQQATLMYNVCHEFSLDDKTISHLDVQTETVTTKMLFKICFTAIIVFLLAADIAENSIFSGIVKAWDYFKYVLAGMYWVGMFLWPVKLLVGRLRPCFLDGCKLSEDYAARKTGLLDASGCTNDNYEYYCQSFFSGHAFLAFYCFMSLVGYVHVRKIKWSLFWYGLLLSVPCWIGYTRIIDNQHHPSDVTAGACAGTLFAVFTYFIVNN